MRHPFSEIRALGLIAIGALLFLALYIYTPDDVPPRFSILSRSVPNDPVLNASGAFGAVLGGYTIFLFGAAAFLLAACFPSATNSIEPAKPGTSPLRTWLSKPGSLISGCGTWKMMTSRILRTSPTPKDS